MAFMKKQVEHGDYYRVEACYCYWVVPAELVGPDPELDDFRDYTDGELVSFEKQTGWYGRMSAPGYLDCTDWICADTEAELIEYLDELYGD